MNHIRPAHARPKVELSGVVGHHAKVERVLVALFDELFKFLCGLLRLQVGLPSLEIGVENEERGREKEHDHEEEEVLEEQAEELAGAHLLLLDEQIVRMAALIAEDSLASNDLGRHAVRV